MDPFSQALIGAAAVQSIPRLRNKLGRVSALLGAAGGLAPDLDILIQSKTDSILYFEYHRHFTHSLAFIPAGGALAMIPFLLFPSLRKKWKEVILAGVVGYATHGLLDAFTSYGTLLFWPFSDFRVAWDVLPIIDPIYTGLLALGVFATLIFIQTSRWVHLALALSVIYMGFAVSQHHSAAQAQQLLAHSRGHQIERSRVLPSIGNLAVWRSIYEFQNVFYSDAIRIPYGAFGMKKEEVAAYSLVKVGGSKPRFTEQQYRKLLEEQQIPGKRIERAIQDFRRFQWFAGDWLVYIPFSWGLSVGDFRYSMSSESTLPIWGFALDWKRMHAIDRPYRTERIRYPGKRMSDDRVKNYWNNIRGYEMNHRGWKSISQLLEAKTPPF